MKNYINKDTYNLYAKTNESLINKEVKGLVVEFPGLGGGSCLGGTMDMGVYDGDFAKMCADEGIILAYIFPGPWSWMNKGAVKITDAIVDAIREKYNLDPDAPIGLSGGSMGGLGAMIYSLETKNKISAVGAACPCCDVLDRFNCKQTFPRTFISAVACYEDMSMEDALKSISPMHRINDFKDVSYFITNSCEDEVFPEELLDSFVQKLLEKGHKVEYRKMPGQKHGEFIPEIKDEFYKFVIDSLLK